MLMLSLRTRSNSHPWHQSMLTSINKLLSEPTVPPRSKLVFVVHALVINQKSVQLTLTRTMFDNKDDSCSLMERGILSFEPTVPPRFKLVFAVHALALPLAATNKR